LCGLDLLHLEPAAGRFDAQLRILADGTWDDGADRPALPADLPERIGWRWELADDRVLSLWGPVRPIPEYHQFEWTREEKQYLVLAVTDLSLALADSHTTVVYRRSDTDAYFRRKAAEYGLALGALKQLLPRSR
jgi:hypothetical protein